MDLFEIAREMRKHEAMTFCSEYIRECGLESFFNTLMNYSPHPALPILKGQARTLDKTDWEY